MEIYHEVWREKHGVEAAFLRECLCNGFDIHHVDGDHTNNEPDNLVLIFSGDHAFLHGLKRFQGRSNGVWLTMEELERERLTKGERAYKMRQNGALWCEIEIKSAMNAAKFYATRHDLPWPIKPEDMTEAGRKIVEAKHAKSRKWKERENAARLQR